jgi:hypothetical protein
MKLGSGSEDERTHSLSFDLSRSTPGIIMHVDDSLKGTEVADEWVLNACLQRLWKRMIALRSDSLKALLLGLDLLGLVYLSF